MPDFISDLSAAVDHLGVTPVGIVWGIAHTNWESADQRDEFLGLLSGKNLIKE
jgi:hypothetical protein